MKFIVSLCGGRGVSLTEESIHKSTNTIDCNNEAECVGKTTMANFLVSECGFIKMSFADPLKEYCMTKYGLSQEDVKFNKEKMLPEYGKTVRQLLQEEGSAGRKDGRWIRLMQEKLDSSPAKYIVIDDSRYPDEQEMLSKYHNLPIKIIRDLKKTDPDKLHESCKQDLNCKYFIINKDLKTLERDISSIILKEIAACSRLD